MLFYAFELYYLAQSKNFGVHKTNSDAVFRIIIHSLSHSFENLKKKKNYFNFDMQHGNVFYKKF